MKIEYNQPMTARFWAAELFVQLPADDALRVLKIERYWQPADAQAAFDIFHRFEDGIEHRPRRELPRLLKFMRQCELTMDHYRPDQPIVN